MFKQNAKFKYRKQLIIMEYLNIFSLPILSGNGEKNNNPNIVPIIAEIIIATIFHSFSQKNPKL